MNKHLYRNLFFIFFILFIISVAVVFFSYNTKNRLLTQGYSLEAEDGVKGVIRKSDSSVQLPKMKKKFDPAALLKPGRLPEMAFGKNDAPVTIVEYASITCFHCARFEELVFPELKKKYIDTGKVRFIFREFPFDVRAEAGFMLARCSGDKYFAMLNILFKQYEKLVTVKNVRETFLNISKQAGFSEESFKACLSNQKLLDDIRAVREQGEKDFNITSTPTFFIEGEQYLGALSLEEISAIIDKKLSE